MNEADKTAPLWACPDCGAGIESLEYREDVLVVHHGLENRAGTVIFSGESKVYWDCSTNERIVCTECDLEIHMGSEDWPTMEFE